MVASVGLCMCDLWPVLPGPAGVKPRSAARVVSAVPVSPAAPPEFKMTRGFEYNQFMTSKARSAVEFTIYMSTCTCTCRVRVLSRVLRQAAQGR